MEQMWNIFFINQKCCCKYYGITRHIFTMFSTVGGIVGLGGIVGNALQLGVYEQYKVSGIQVLDVRVYHMRLSVQLVNFSLF